MRPRAPDGGVSPVPARAREAPPCAAAAPESTRRARLLQSRRRRSYASRVLVTEGTGRTVLTNDSCSRSANDFVQLTRAGFGNQTKATLGQGLTKRESQRVDVDHDMQDPGPGEVRTEIRRQRVGADASSGEVE